MIKKSFCDAWDNLLSVVITNAICALTTLGFAYLFFYTAKFEKDWLSALIFIGACIVVSILVFAYGDSAAAMANFDNVRIRDYFKAIPGCLLDGALFGLMISIVTIISVIGISYYWSEAFLTQFQLVGVFLGALLMWMDIFFIFSIQWFLPIRSLMHNKFFKCLKKCFLVFFDNTGFSIAMFLHNLILTALSVVCAGIIPSFGGILIASTNALRLRLYKYDYLEEHPELTTKRQRRQIPWEELIYDDKETLGPRKLKSFLFPWKED